MNNGESAEHAAKPDRRTDVEVLQSQCQYAAVLPEY